MTETGIALLGYISWTILLLVCLAIYRTTLVQSKQKKGLKFAADGSDVPDFGQRLTRAHANCAECFVMIGGVLLYALATNMTNVTDGLAYGLLGARLAQSLVHLLSTSNLAIQARFVFFLVQIGIIIYWLVQFISA